MTEEESAEFKPAEFKPAEPEPAEPKPAEPKPPEQLEWERQFLTDLANISEDNAPAVQILLMAQAGGWFASEDNPGSGYTEEHASQLIGVLFWAIQTAPGFTPERQPEPTENIAAFWAQLTAGAAELAELGVAGIEEIVTRGFAVLPADLEDNNSDPDKQMTATCMQLLLLIATGSGADTDPEQRQQVVLGIVESDLAWDKLVSEGMAIEL